MKITKTYLFFLLVFPVFTLPSSCNRVVDKENNTITITQDLPQMDKTTFFQKHWFGISTSFELR